MRIISGKYKGKRITAPKSLPVRPTTDMAKEALFNILHNRFYFEEIKVLDLFCGTGNIGFEFASRGVSSIVSVDKDYRCVKFVARIASEMQMNIRTFKEDAFKFLEKTTDTFDIIFADPPYHLDTKKFMRIVELVAERQLLNEGGLLILEHSKHTELTEAVSFVEKRNYGGSVFSFFGA